MEIKNCKSCPNRQTAYLETSRAVKKELKNALNIADFVEGDMGNSLRGKLKDIFGYRGIRGFLQHYFGQSDEM